MSRELRWLPLLAFALAAGAALSAIVLQKHVGVARDEVVYLDAAPKYAQWWVGVAQGQGLISKQGITTAFGGRGATDNNREHPPLVKTMIGFSQLVAERVGWRDTVAAGRVPGALFFGLLIWVVVMWSGRAFGLCVGALAGAFAWLMPRMLFHAQLAAFDVPIAALWILTLWAFWRMQISSTRRGATAWTVITACAFGLALATKHNAVILPIVMAVHTAWVQVQEARALQAPWWTGLVGWLRGLLRIGAIVGGGLVLLVAVWPWLWLAPLQHVGEWLGFHLTHVHYNFEYLGTNWNHPPYPWHVPLITTLLVVPATTLALALVGTIVTVVAPQRPLTRSPAMLWFLSASFAMGPFLLTTTPIFGAEKHWAAAMPTLAVAAGVGAKALLVWVGRLRWPVVRAALWSTTGAALLLGPIADTWVAQPHALTHYNLLAGGAAGGADLGLNRQFWGQAALGVVPALSGRQRDSATPVEPIYTHDASPAWSIYQKRFGLSRFPDAGHEAAGIVRSTWGLVLHEKHFVRHDAMIWEAYGTSAPVWVLTAEGVPIVSLYQRPPR